MYTSIGVPIRYIVNECLVGWAKPLAACVGNAHYWNLAGWPRMDEVLLTLG